jgi:biopolymer transport protein ExbD
MSPVMTFGDGKSAKQAQHDTMASFGPARLATDKKWNGEVTTKKIRVWADNEYRTQNRNWQKTFEEPLELANLVLTPILGLRLVAEFAVWERHVPGATLDDHLAALIEHDRGNDVFVVVGLTSSLPLVSSTFEALGYASVGGRHMVLRGYADLEERKMYANAFPDLRADERELALVHLRHHKTAVILLHELGHNFGSDHETEGTIMSATYSNHATSFSDKARITMLRTIDHRLGREPTVPGEAPPAEAAAASAQPAAAPAPPAVRREPIVIRVTKAGHTIVDGKKLDATALDALFKSAFVDDTETAIVIKQDRKVPTGAVGDVIDRAKAIGLSKFEFGWTGQ